MHFRVSELTEMALQIMGYQMYDRNGTATDSLSQVIQPHLADTLDAGAALVNQDLPSSSNRSTRREQDQFMADFGITDVATVLNEPDQYAETQMMSLLELLEARIMRTKMMMRFPKKANALREKNAKDNDIEITYFCNKLRVDCINVPEVEIGATSSQTEQDKQEAYEAKQEEQLEEFNMLLQLLKIILDDMPDNWRELDKIWQLLKTSTDMIKSIEDSRV